MKSHLIGQDRRLIPAKLGIIEVTLGMSQPLGGVPGSHTLALRLVHYLTPVLRIPVNQADLLAHRLKSAVGHHDDVYRHV